ncbi:MAG TPA: AmmeMemoRadiSam system protein B [Ignavibacteriaceae bacterium]|jgi:AmmeMemoRadiSam system protein B|nr:AmmeMemoRadiSam system protein B [Ignavibacteriaceae bacterium]
MSLIRKPAAAGYFYPADASKLKAEIDVLLSISEKREIPGKLFGIVSPHAGYIYSGKTAAFGYNLFKGKNIKHVIILSPSHREYFPGISVYEGDAYQTPLGIVPVNKKMAESLTGQSKTIFMGEEGHRDEHAIEVQVPFLQTVLDDFDIVPVVMGDQGKLFIDELAEKITNSIDESTVIVSSSDLSHYYKADAADRMDSIVERDISNFNYEGLFDNFEAGTCEACGAGTIIAMMKSADKLNYHNSMVLYRNNSGDTTGDKREVVGYLSAAVYGD